MEEMGVPVRVGADFGTYQHGYTHFKVTLHAFCCQVESGIPQALHASEIRWVAIAELGIFPMGKIDRQIARRLSQEKQCG
jgi:A/G-specific adenine glycosylase